MRILISKLYTHCGKTQNCENDYDDDSDNNNCDNDSKVGYECDCDCQNFYQCSEAI